MALPPFYVIRAYVIFILGLAILPLVPTETTRLIYLHTMTFFTILLSPKNALLYGLMGMIHSGIHIWKQFLQSDKFDLDQSHIIDLTLHLIMLVIAQNLVIKNQKSNHKEQDKLITIISVIAFVGSVINLIVALYMDHTGFLRYIYVNTSLFRNISSAYWIILPMWHNHWHLPEFKYHWLGSVICFFLHWVFYRYNSNLMFQSLKYHYLQGLFMTSTWHFIFDR